MKKLNVAIIGQGRSGRSIHGAFFKSELNEKFNITAIVEEIKERREKAKEEWGCPVYKNYTELFERKDIDFVVNASFSHQHAQITMDLMEHGFNVISEKPFAKSFEEGQEMIRCAKKNKVFLAPFQQSRIAPYFQEIKKILNSGILGEVIQVSISFSGFARRWDWQTSLRYFGGNVRNTGPHPIDQAMDLLGFSEDISVFSKLKTVNTFGDAEDYAKIIMTAPNKPLIDLEISSCNAYSPYTYVISCKNGSLRATQNLIEYKYFDPAEAPKQKFTLKPLTSSKGTPAYCSETLPWIEEKIELKNNVFANDTVRDYYDLVYDKLVNGKDMPITSEQVLCQLKVIDLVHAQNPLKVKY